MGIFRKYYLVVGFIIVTAFGLLALENCSQSAKSPLATPELPHESVAEAKFTGSQACARCHHDIYQQHLQSFHHLTSVPANSQTLVGDFDSANRYYINDHLYIAAERRNDSFYQTAYLRDLPKLSRPFNIVVGSGKRWQTS